MAPRHTSTANKRKTNSSKTQNQSVGNKIIYRHHTFLLGWKFWLSKCGRWPGVGLSLILFNFLSKRWLFETIWCNSCKFSCGECFCFLLRHKSFQFKCSQLVDKSHYIHFLHLWPPSPEDGPELVQATTNCQKHFRHLCPLFRHFCPKDVLVGGWVRKSGRQLPQLCSFPPPLPSFLTLGGIHKAEWMLLLIL